MGRMFNRYDEKICEELLKMPVKALGLSSDVQSAIDSIELMDFRGNRKKAYATVQDVLKGGKEKFQQIFSRSDYFKKNPLMILELEEKLMKIGFKFKDSTFSVYDVRVSELDLTDKAKEFMAKNIRSVKTIGDLSVRTLKEMANCIHDGDYSALCDLKNALEDYGVKFVESAYDLDKARCFPIKDKVYYLSESTMNDYFKNYKKRHKSPKSMGTVSREFKKKLPEEAVFEE